ncbi:MAG: glycosyltransferase family 1 protein [Candidatus Moranbacteria bacterium]|nr:glycosyltransferase family 1 protein [Candidatus Moranbacteria bacterium]
MKIGIDIRCLASGKRTGVEEYTMQLLENIFLRDRENTYILFLNLYKDTDVDLGFVEQYPNVFVKRFRIPNKLLNFCLWYFRFPKIDRLLGGVDMFFMPNMNFIAVSKGVKLFVTAHDLSFERYPEMFSWKRRFWHILVNFRYLCRRAHHIFAVSESTKTDVVILYDIPEKKVSTMLSGVSSKFMVMNRNSPELIAVKEKYKLPYKFILYLGTIEPRKNIVAIIRAYDQLQKTGDAELQKYALVIAGVCGWKCDEIFREIERSPYREQIIVTDFVDDEDKPALYNLSSLFVYPSFFEGFGLPPAEAMRCGIPVIVSFTSSFPEVVGSAGIMIDPYQPDDLFHAMQEVLLSKDLHDALGKKGVERSKELNWQKTAQDIIRHFRG